MTRAKGPDISTWQRSPYIPGEPNIDLLIDDEDFVIFKYSQDQRQDEDLDFWYSHIHGKKPTSGYHFGEYKKYAKPQAVFAIDTLKKYPADFVFSLDIESYTEWDKDLQKWVPVPLPPAYNMVQWIFNFADPFKEEFGHFPMMYINGSMALYIKRSGHGRLNDLKTFPLWLSCPGPEQHIYDLGYMGIWDHWTFWQNTWKADGYANGVESKDLDYNQFNNEKLGPFNSWISYSEVVPPVVSQIDITAELATIRAELDKIQSKVG